MKKKFLAIYALTGALVASPIFTSCVDDKESDSVTAVRNAKAEQLKALAALSNAQAEAELIKANAEKAMKEAQAAFNQAQAEQYATNTEYYKQKYALELEMLKAQYEEQIARYKANTAIYEKDVWDNADAFVQGVYEKYIAALGDINEINEELITQKLRLAQIDIDEISAKAALESFLYEKNQIIAQKTQEITRLESLKTADKAEIKKQMDEMSANAYNLMNTDKPAAEKVKKEAEDAFWAAYQAIDAKWPPQNEHEKKAWEEALLPYLKAWNYLDEFKTIDENGNEVFYYFTDRLWGENTVEIAECPTQKGLIYYTTSKQGSFLQAETDANNYFKGQIAGFKEKLGVPSVEGKSEATGVYSWLENAQNNLKAAKEALDAELKKAAAEQDQVAIEGYNKTIENETVSIAQAEQQIAYWEEKIKKAEEAQKEFQDAVAAVQDATLIADYDKAFASAKELAEAALKAEHEVHKIDDAIELIGIENFDSNGAPVGPFNGEYSDLEQIYNGSIDIEKLVLNCKKTIADAEAAIKAGGNQGWVEVSEEGGNMVEVWNLAHTNGHTWSDNMEVKIYKYTADMTVEERKAIIQAEIDKLNEELTVQQTLAEQYKAKLDSMLTADAE